MKRIRSILAVLLMLTMLAACGQPAASPNPAPSNSTPSGTTSSNPAPNVPEPDKEDIAWPEKPLTLIVSGGAGGGQDLQGRLFVQYLEKKLGQTIVVNNITNLPAYQTFLEAENDGYTFMMSSAAFFVYEGLETVPYGLDDFTPLLLLDDTKTNGLFVRSDSKYQTLDDLIEDIKAHPGEIQIGTAASTYFHVFLAAMLDALNLDAVVVDAGIDQDRTVALVGGHIDVIVSQYSNAIKPYIDSGEVRCLGIAQNERDATMPDVPTFQEQGYDFTYPGQLFMFLSSKGVDEAVLEKLHNACNAVLEDPDFQADIAQFGVVTYPPMSLQETNDTMYQMRDLFVASCDLIK